MGLSAFSGYQPAAVLGLSAFGRSVSLAPAPAPPRPGWPKPVACFGSRAGRARLPLPLRPIRFLRLCPAGAFSMSARPHGGRRCWRTSSTFCPALWVRSPAARRAPIAPKTESAFGAAARPGQFPDAGRFRTHPDHHPGRGIHREGESFRCGAGRRPPGNRGSLPGLGRGDSVQPAALTGNGSRIPARACGSGPRRLAPGSLFL